MSSLFEVYKNKHCISITLKRSPKYQFSPQGKPRLSDNNQWGDDSSIVDTVILSTQRYTCCRSLVVCIVEMKSCERFTLLMPIQLTIIIVSFYALSVLNLYTICRRARNFLIYRWVVGWACLHEEMYINEIIFLQQLNDQYCLLQQ